LSRMKTGSFPAIVPKMPTDAIDCPVLRARDCGQADRRTAQYDDKVPPVHPSPATRCRGSQAGTLSGRTALGCAKPHRGARPGYGKPRSPHPPGAFAAGLSRSRGRGAASPPYSEDRSGCANWRQARIW
jgi:hypothetical protein